MSNGPNEQERDGYKQLGDYFKLFSHPVRLKILEILRKEPACVCHINAILDLRQAYVSQQLAVLREGGVINDQKDGWNVFYHITNPEMYEFIDIAWKIIDPEGKLNKADLSIPEDCDCPRCQETEDETN